MKKKKKKRSWLEEEGARRLAYKSSLPLWAACLGLTWTCVGTNTGTLPRTRCLWCCGYYKRCCST